MTISATPQGLDGELAERLREAWGQYRDGLRDLDGRAYEEAEAASWDHLQETLAAIDAAAAGS